MFGGIRTCLIVSSNSMFLWISLNSCRLNLLLVQSHQVEITIVKRLIQTRNNVTRVRVEPRSCDQGRLKIDAFTHSITCISVLAWNPFFVIGSDMVFFSSILDRIHASSGFCARLSVAHFTFGHLFSYISRNDICFRIGCYCFQFLFLFFFFRIWSPYLRTSI